MTHLLMGLAGGKVVIALEVWNIEGMERSALATPLSAGAKRPVVVCVVARVWYSFPYSIPTAVLMITVEVFRHNAKIILKIAKFDRELA